MKQVITRDQWLELTDKQQAKALDWLKGKFENAFTIGMMIEFLDWDDMEIYLGKKQLWFVQDGDYENAGKCFSGLSICDALWVAVKEKIKAK